MFAFMTHLSTALIQKSQKLLAWILNNYQKYSSTVRPRIDETSLTCTECLPNMHRVPPRHAARTRAGGEIPA